MSKLKNKLDEIEVACFMVSGNKKTMSGFHFSFVSVPIGIRFATLKREGVVRL